MFDGMISPNLLPSKHAMPQGDPLSPLILAIWVSAGLRCTEAEQSNQSPQTVQYAAYMDDRSFGAPLGKEFKPGSAPGTRGSGHGPQRKSKKNPNYWSFQA